MIRVSATTGAAVHIICAASRIIRVGTAAGIIRAGGREQGRRLGSRVADTIIRAGPACARGCVQTIAWLRCLGVPPGRGSGWPALTREPPPEPSATARANHSLASLPGCRQGQGVLGLRGQRGRRRSRRRRHGPRAAGARAAERQRASGPDDLNSGRPEPRPPDSNMPKQPLSFLAHIVDTIREAARRRAASAVLAHSAGVRPSRHTPVTRML